jgi:hypothetical protein
MDENIKVLLIIVPIILPVVYLMMRMFIADPEFRKGIYYILTGGTIFFGWVMLVNHIL